MPRTLRVGIGSAIARAAMNWCASNPHARTAAEPSMKSESHASAKTKLSVISRTTSDAATQYQPGTSSLSSRCRIFVSSTNVRVNCGSAFTSGAGIAGSSGR